MKKLLSILAGLLLMLSSLPALAQQAPAGPEQKPVVIGSLTDMSGRFMGNFWGNNTVDMDIRRLLHQYNTIHRTLFGRLSPNPNTVESLEITRDAQGNRVYTITLHDDLFFSDGSRLTAKDYLYVQLMEASSLMDDVGATVKEYNYLVGYEEYFAVETDVLKGARLINDRTFALIVRPEALPYYWELSYAAIQPFSMKEISPGTDIRDDGEGAYLVNRPTGEELNARLFTPGVGYVSHPNATTGPYKLDSFDPETAVATFSINPYYKGNIDGIKPTIQNLVVRPMRSADIVNDLASGELTIANKVSSASVIDEAIQSGFQLIDYPRTGLAYVAFAMEEGPTGDLNIRQAIAHSLDKQALVDDFLGDYGEVVDGYFGRGQWMFQAVKGRRDSMQRYPTDPGAAQMLLERAGYTLNAQGAAFTPQEDVLRYKRVDGQLEPLSLHFLITPENEPAEILVAQLEKNLVPLGAELTVERAPVRELLSRFYRQKERRYDIAFLASDFDTFFDPFFTFHVADQYQGSLNQTGARDTSLMNNALAMRRTPNDQNVLYLERWREFQERFTQVLPLIPIYSNDYHDLYRPQIANYHPEDFSSFAEAIVEATYAVP